MHEIVIAGGGIVGVSVAYHLAKLGRRDVVLLEQGRLTCGTTWHAAGLVGQMRPEPLDDAHEPVRHRALFDASSSETGLATGWKQCGSVNVARTPERWIVFQRQAAMARSFGIEVELLTPRQALEKWPLLRIDDLQGALWFPADGKANPADLAQSLAKGARNLGVKIAGRRAHHQGQSAQRIRQRRRDQRRPDRLRDLRQLHRPVGARARRAERREHPAAFGRALLHRHRADRRRASDAAGDARSRRLHLLQGGGRRPADGRLRAGGQALGHGRHPGQVRVPAPARGLGPVPAADGGGDAPRAGARDRRASRSC